MECNVSFLDPLTRHQSDLVIGKKLCIGRNPGASGLVVGSTDNYVSSIAVELPPAQPYIRADGELYLYVYRGFNLLCGKP